MKRRTGEWAKRRSTKILSASIREAVDVGLSALFCSADPSPVHPLAHSPFRPSPPFAWRDALQPLLGCHKRSCCTNDAGDSLWNRRKEGHRRRPRIFESRPGSSRRAGLQRTRRAVLATPTDQPFLRQIVAPAGPNAVLFGNGRLSLSEDH